MKYLYILTILMLFSLEVFSQHEEVNNATHIFIELQNGKKIQGQVISSDSESILIQNQLGEIKVERLNIKSITVSESLEILEEKIYRNFNDSYLLLPSARPVGQGNSHYKNYNLFYNQFNFGISDNFSLGAGFESLSFFAGEFSRIFFIAPKFSLGKGMNHFGIGTTAFLVTDGGIGGLAFINYTYGTDTKNITLGASFAYSGEGDGNPAIFNINLMYPVAKNVSFISEVILGDFEGVLFDFGFRFKTKSGIAFDAGVARPAGNGSDIFGIPLLGITIPFK